MKFQFTLTRKRDDEKGKIHTDTKVFSSMDELKYFINSLSAYAVTPDEELDPKIIRDGKA